MKKEYDFSKGKRGAIDKNIKLGGSGVCPHCLFFVSNIAYHEPRCFCNPCIPDTATNNSNIDEDAG